MMNRIFVAQPKLAGNERKYVLDCLDTNWISSIGKYIGAFESEAKMLYFVAAAPVPIASRTKAVNPA